ncbi:hypothetical protein E3N88_32267 [Mikania micrantha]|uniref:Retrovirus-related Pol polyprotein from transposon TNT 1-94-like beta-barrel domain-containing protein n=1 Tax=Mikania micrantha TaxID=192012 RepID=A0A5N6MAN4_9ASTR|nr:hypothetical protein E3N88_43199 [Mikania micrantha]KAD3336748.1 hypothetical protein E3N88_32267 [Mikania micrantha]
MTQKAALFKGQQKRKSVPPSRHGKTPKTRKGKRVVKPAKITEQMDKDRVGHIKSQCPGTSKQVNAIEGVYDDDALVCSTESCVDSWVMNSGASFHAMDNGETMLNLKKGDFGKIQFANDELLEVTGIGDQQIATTGVRRNPNPAMTAAAAAQKTLDLGGANLSNRNPNRDFSDLEQYNLRSTTCGGSSGGFWE